MEYYVIIDGRKCGPFSHEELRSKFVTPNMPVWRDGLADWTPARNLPEISDVLQPEPTPPPYYSGGAQQQAYEPKSRKREYIPPMPEDYKSSNIFLIVFGFLCCSVCMLGSIFAIISYINANEMKTLYAVGQYEMATLKAATVRKYHNWAIWTDVIFIILGVIGLILYIVFLGGLAAFSSQYQ
ncbi:MAG: DUF4339 domain-containing protein [Prevotella sp.]|nr:DUF4339 domain-containing protein [Prevotella sp.]